MATYWLIGGIVLMLLEIVVPGLVLVFLGAGATIVALLLWLGFIDHWMPAATSWFAISLVLILTLRGMLQKWTGGESEKQSTDEDAAAMGTVVTVTQIIRPGEEGRISYRDSTWPAICHDEELPVGAEAKLVYRDNVAWIVEPNRDPHALPELD